MRHNEIDSQSGDPAEEEIGNFSLDPQFLSGTLNYELAFTSPLLEAGLNPTLDKTFEDAWDLTPVDITGEPRLQGSKVDIGAYERIGDLIFKDGYD